MSRTLASILKQCEYILIPMLQRDFAQGRPSARGILNRFIDALKDALCRDQYEPPLDLDFVYGRIADDKVFRPLDGQQRLTTLFLLHWYLAERDGCRERFRILACAGENSRFGYEIRPSSRDFFNSLVCNDMDLHQLDDASDTALSEHIRDAAWFFQSWSLDPTIESCLAVLDTLHRVFKDSGGLFERLVDPDRPAITFQFLDLEAFQLTDDLYIKMNARGKPLTTYETFKANFEKQIEPSCPRETKELEGHCVSLRQYVSHRFDSRWADLFWGEKVEDTSFDQKVMNGIRAVALVATPPNEEHDPLLRDLVDAKLNSFFDYEAAGLVNGKFVQTLVFLFDRWSGDDGRMKTCLVDSRWYDEAEVFQRVLAGRSRGKMAMTYAHWIQFIAWCAFLQSERPTTELDEWMRVISNLSRNTIYNRVSEFRASLAGMRKLLEHSDLLAYLADRSNKVEGFNRQQFREEQIKAQLIQRAPEWRPLIEQAETHGYFDGQLEFLLAFSGILERWQDTDAAEWSDGEDDSLREAFSEWFRKANAVFDGNGLREFPDKLWERALLCEGDYLLRRGSNHGFLDNADRELGWKRLLRSDLGNEEAEQKRVLVMNVLKDLDPDDATGSLQRHVDAGVRTPSTGFPAWRERFVEFPQLIDYCLRRQIRIVNDKTIYLLRQTQRNGYHAELYTAHLRLRLDQALWSGAVAPFDRSGIDDVCTDSKEPAIEFRSSSEPDLILRVTYSAEHFRGVVSRCDAVVDEWTVRHDRGEDAVTSSATRLRPRKDL